MGDFKWHHRFMNIAKEVATWSKDPKTKVGAVITNKKHLISIGYNGFPITIDDNLKILNNDDKHLYMIHAEQNAILNSPMSVKGFFLYSTLFPCNDCAKVIIQSGINTLITYQPQYNKPKCKWDISKDMLDQAGIKIIYMENLDESND